MVQVYPMGSEAVSLNTVLEYVDKLDIEDQQYVQEIIHSRLIEKKRSAIVHPGKTEKKQHAQTHEPERERQKISGGSEWLNSSGMSGLQKSIRSGPASIRN